MGIEDKQLLTRMCETIKHRGPNSTGFYIDKDVGLGVDRLSVIDLQTGDQPIHNEDGSVTIVYNGEVYNYVELREELERRGHVFRTLSDTETIVHGYEEWGEGVLLHLRGMFAFALWDCNKKKLFVARDRFGKKPLYYAQVGGVFIFASELKSILQYEYFPREVNESVLGYFFTYLYVPSPQTIFSTAKKLPPGHYLTYEKGEIRVKEYWDFELLPKSDVSFDQAVDLVYEKLLESVKIRLRSDVPLGAFLSGGIDSSVVVSLMKKVGVTEAKTFSIGFHESYYNETADAREVADYVGTDHTERWVEPDIIPLLPKLVWHFDEPFGDSSMIPTYMVAQETRKDVTVALTGDGGDEVFVGYPWLVDPSVYSFYNKVPRPVRRAGLKVLGKVPIQTRLTRMARRASTMDYGDQDEKERYMLRASHIHRDELTRLYSEESRTAMRGFKPMEYFDRYFERTTQYEFLDAADYVTVKTYLPEDILTKVDRMTMAVSLEGRCPLLDHELAELVAHLPVTTKNPNKVLKGLLKAVASKYRLVPRRTLNKPKHGFGTPIDYWLKKQWKEIASSVLSPERSRAVKKYLDATAVSRMLADPMTYRDQLFSLMSFVLWHQMFVESDDNVPYLRLRL